MKKKRVLYLTNCYAQPYQISVGPATRHYYHVNALTERGVFVNVVTASKSTISDSDLDFNSSNENISIRALSVNTINNNNLLSRITYHIVYFFKALLICIKLEKNHIIISSIPTLLIGWIGFIISRFHNAYFILDVRDLWSDSLSTTSLSRIPLFLKFNQWIESYLYSKADVIYCTSKAQVKTVSSYIKNNVPVFYVPNGIDPEVTDSAKPNPFIHKIRNRYKYIGLFAGKHSIYTDLDNLINAAKELADENFALILIGGGYCKNQLMKRTIDEKISNVFFHDPVPKTEIASFEAGADIFFINYSNEKIWAKVLPNKLFDYLYWNKPIIAAVAHGEITKIIEDCESGISVDPEKPSAIAGAVRFYMKKTTYNINSRKYLFEHFNRKKTVQNFIRILNPYL